MTEVLSAALAELQRNSIQELMAVILAVAYLLLAVRQNIYCWYAAFLSSAIFLVVFWQVDLFMESGLQVYYLIAAATWISGQLLEGSYQRLAYLDSFTTWSAILTTYMVVRKILENWIYWLVIDTASIYLYVDRGLYFTALLFTIYIVIILFGFRAWLTDYRTKNDLYKPA